MYYYSTNTDIYYYADRGFCHQFKTKGDFFMFIKVVPNSKGRKGTYFCYLVEAYRENGTIKHRIVHNFGLLEEDQVPFLKAMYAKKKPRLVYDDETM